MIRPGSSGSGDKHRQDLCNISWGTNSGSQTHVVPQAPSTLHIVLGPKPAEDEEVSASGMRKKSQHLVLNVILINGQFPGPKLDAVPNDNLIMNVIEETIV